MPQGSHKEFEPYVHEEFVCVKCKKCGSESNPFVHKDHLTPDELIGYIVEITGFSVDKMNSEDHTESSYINTGKNSHRGGLLCPICNENILKEVV